MLNFQALVIDRFVDELKTASLQYCSPMEPQAARLIEGTSRLVLEKIAKSDNLYHNIDHTILVSLAGINILKGKHLLEGGVTAEDWLQFVVACLCHDIGYVRGVCELDRMGSYATGIGDELVFVNEDWTDSVLTPYHIDRSKQFVFELFRNKSFEALFDPEIIASYIEMTRFPIPDTPHYQNNASLGGLLRAADLIGQLGDPDYLRKIPALYYEFEENGVNHQIGYDSPGDMRRRFNRFYTDVVLPHIGDAVRFLNTTKEGEQWIANLTANLYRVSLQTGANGQIG